MGKRVTIILDDELIKKIRIRQAKLIQKSVKSVSFSKIINDLVRNGLKTV